MLLLWIICHFCPASALQFSTFPWGSAGLGGFYVRRGGAQGSLFPIPDFHHQLGILMEWHLPIRKQIYDTPLRYLKIRKTYTTMEGRSMKCFLWVAGHQLLASTVGNLIQPASISFQAWCKIYIFSDDWCKILSFVDTKWEISTHDLIKISNKRWDITVSRFPPRCLWRGRNHKWLRDLHPLWCEDSV